ncbi:DUF6035 family protein [Reyranella sp.]|uniref:DUF6035 family protein n=1 Tax=Reyranella sp. TaxID=1929291 RepID=UPI002731AEA1|nr:DUF6035 family protein [Reyranella sp.]MDP2376004.1 DUF6035 family protein [Reyranella sp.]
MVVTIDPEKHARAAKRLEIKEVRSFVSGRIIDSRKFIERPTYYRLIRARSKLQEARHRKKVRITCAICGVPVYLVARTTRDFYFRHTLEDGKCPAVTRSKLTADEIKAMKYLGARESPAHKQTKEFIEQSLKVDAAFSNILAEKRWSSKDRKATYRQPDVQARLGEMRIAFEVQLSTTFLSVVVGRREFYRSENAMLIWVLRRFDPADRRLTIDDLLFNNNSNILVVDDETVKLSEEQSAFVARCWYREPHLDEDEVRHRWSSKLVKVREMTFNVEEQQAFGFDVQSRKRELHRELEQQVERERQKPLDDAREAFFRFCEYRTNHTDYETLEIDFDDSTEPLRELGVPMPRSVSEAATFIQHVLVLRSIQLGKPVGYRYNKLVQVLHTMAESYKDFLYFVGYALNIYGCNKLVAEQDSNGKWAKKCEAIRMAMKDRDPAYEPTMEWAKTFPILFPALAGIPKWAARRASLDVAVGASGQMAIE